MYVRLLIEEAQNEEKPASISLRWKAGFAPNKRRLKERMDNLMKNRRWNRFAAGTLVAALVFANSMTVLAYRDAHNEIMPEDVALEDIETVLESDTVVFAPEDTGEEAIIDFGEDTVEILYDRQFVDEEGNIYYIPDMESHGSCDHSYVAGTEYRHNKGSDGGCVVTVYKAERCSKCGTIKLGDKVSTTTYVTCPH